MISITRNPSSTSEYHAAIQVEKFSNSRIRAGNDAGAAAAKAIELAIGYGAEYGYAIFAPDEVMELIPHDMRARRKP